MKPLPFPGRMHRFRWRRRGGRKGLLAQMAKVEGWL